MYTLAFKNAYWTGSLKSRKVIYTYLNNLGNQYRKPTPNFSVVPSTIPTGLKPTVSRELMKFSVEPGPETFIVTYSLGLKR